MRSFICVAFLMASGCEVISDVIDPDGKTVTNTVTETVTIDHTETNTITNTITEETDTVVDDTDIDTATDTGIEPVADDGVRTMYVDFIQEWSTFAPFAVAAAEKDIFLGAWKISPSLDDEDKVTLDSFKMGIYINTDLGPTSTYALGTDDGVKASDYFVNCRFLFVHTGELLAGPVDPDEDGILLFVPVDYDEYAWDFTGAVICDLRDDMPLDRPVGLAANLLGTDYYAPEGFEVSADDGVSPTYVYTTDWNGTYLYPITAAIYE